MSVSSIMLFTPFRLLAAVGALVFLAPAGAGASPADTGIAARPVLPAPALRGVVRDSGGRPLPNATVVIGGLNRTATTDAEGRFVFRGLPAGRYHLDVMLPGYARADADVVLPPAGDDVHVTIVMARAVVRITGVVVTASPTGDDQLAFTQSAVELSGKQLSRQLGASVAQTLADEPGLATRFSGPAAALPVVRGLTGDRIVVLQDGERAGDLAGASSDHGLTVDPMAAQRIEVVRGPGSLLYGPNAIGGVVNVISNDVPTNVPASVEGYAGLQGETVNPGGALAAGVTVPLGDRFAATLRGSVRDIDDVRTGAGRLPNTDARNWNALASVGWVAEHGAIGVGYRGYDFEYGVPSAPDDDEAGIRLDGRRDEALLRGSWNTGWTAFPYLKVDGTAQWYAHDELEPSGEVGTEFALRTQTLNVTGKTRLGRLSGAVGVQGLFRDYDATGEEAFTPGARSDNVGVFLFQELPLGPTDADGHAHDEVPALQAGVRWDRYRIRSEAGAEDPDRFGPPRTRRFDAFSGSVGLNVPVGAGVSVAASVARAFRAPTVEELFADGFHAAVGTYDEGNPDLDAEVSIGVDGVLRVERRAGSAQVSAYYNRVADYVAPVPVGVADVEGELVPLVRYMQRDATLYGAEGQGELLLGERLVAGVSGDIVRGTLDDDGGPLPFMPAARVGGWLRWDDGRVSVGARVRHAFAQERVTDPDPASDGAVDIPTDAYTLVGLDLGYTFMRRALAHTIALRLDNVFDEEYRDATSRIKRFAPNPGRNVSVVYRVQF